MISNCNAHVKTAYGVNVKKHTLLKPHLFISRHLNQLIKYILPIYQIILIGLCPLMLFYFQVYLFTIPIFFFFPVFAARSLSSISVAFDTPSEPGKDILLF